MSIENELNKVPQTEQQQNVAKSDNEDGAVSEITEEQEKEKVEKSKQEQEETASKLKKIREEIGIPQPKEEPPSIKSSNPQIAKSADRETDDKETDIKKERQKYSKFIDSAKSILNILKRRDGDRLSPLLDETNLSRMSFAVKNIEDLFSQETLDKDSLNKEIDKISSAINSMGEARRGGREDIGSLTVLITKLNGFRDDCGDLIRIISKFDSKEQDEDSIKALDRVFQSCDSSSKVVARIRKALADYTRR